MQFVNINDLFHKIKISNIVEENGGHGSFGYFPNIKYASVKIYSYNAIVRVHESDYNNISSRVTKINNTTLTEFKCVINNISSGYEAQSIYYQFLSGYIFCKRRCNFKIDLKFIGNDDRVIRDDSNEFVFQSPDTLRGDDNSITEEEIDNYYYEGGESESEDYVHENEEKEQIIVGTDEKTKIEELQCIVCNDNKLQLMFSECNHFCVCFSCGNALEKCPICRNVSDCIKIFIR